LLSIFSEAIPKASKSREHACGDQQHARESIMFAFCSPWLNRSPRSPKFHGATVQRSAHRDRHGTGHSRLEAPQERDRQIHRHDSGNCEKVIDRTNRARSLPHRFQSGFLSISSSRATEFPIITTAPATVMPKPMAPRLIRIALMPDSRMPRKLITIGIIEAVMAASRILPRNNGSTTVTRRKRSKRFLSKE
jgi:hypothetical protein